MYYTTLASTPPGDMIPQEVLQECVGIEAFLGQEQRLLMQAKKRAHIKAIVKGGSMHSVSKNYLSSRSRIPAGLLIKRREGQGG